MLLEWNIDTIVVHAIQNTNLLENLIFIPEIDMNELVMQLCNGGSQKNCILTKFGTTCQTCCTNMVNSCNEYIGHRSFHFFLSSFKMTLLLIFKWRFELFGGHGRSCDLLDRRYEYKDRTSFRHKQAVRDEIWWWCWVCRSELSISLVGSLWHYVLY